MTGSAVAEMLCDQAHRLGNIAQFGGAVGAQVRDVFLAAHRLLDHRSFAGGKMKRQAHHFERQQEVGEDDGGVDAEDFGSGDGDLGGQRGLLADFEQRMLLADRAIFGHVASGLAHEPDGRAVDGLGLAGANEAGIRGRHEFLNVAFFREECCDRGEIKHLTTEDTGTRRENFELVESVHGVQGCSPCSASSGWASAFAARLVRRPEGQPAPTFYKDVLPILQDHCQSCHRPGEVAPMPLVTYEQTRPWAAAMAHAVEMKMMPPWFADPRYGHFANDISLTPQQIATISAWAAAGAPAGDRARRACAAQMG